MPRFCVFIIRFCELQNLGQNPQNLAIFAFQILCESRLYAHLKYVANFSKKIILRILNAVSFGYNCKNFNKGIR